MVFGAGVAAGDGDGDPTAENWSVDWRLSNAIQVCAACCEMGPNVTSPDSPCCFFGVWRDCTNAIGGAGGSPAAGAAAAGTFGRFGLAITGVATAFAHDAPCVFANGVCSVAAGRLALAGVATAFAHGAPLAFACVATAFAHGAPLAPSGVATAFAHGAPCVSANGVCSVAAGTLSPAGAAKAACGASAAAGGLAIAGVATDVSVDVTVSANASVGATGVSANGACPAVAAGKAGGEAGGGAFAAEGTSWSGAGGSGATQIILLKLCPMGLATGSMGTLPGHFLNLSHPSHFTGVGSTSIDSYCGFESWGTSNTSPDSPNINVGARRIASSTEPF